MRASYELEEGLNLAEGEVVLLDANHESEPEAAQADVHVSLGRYIGLSTSSGAGGESRLCVVGQDYATTEDVPTDGACAAADDWTANVLCAVNMENAEPACVGTGLLIAPREGTARFRARIVTDDMNPDGDFFAGITLQVQEVGGG